MPHESPARWEDEGRRIAAALDGAAAVLVLAEDPSVAAAVALGAGRAQAKTRRVAIADLVGEIPALQAHVAGDDPHGITDSFLYGVSLNRIAHRVGEGGQLFVMPSGTEPVIGEEMLASPRWGRLARGFREEGALLLLVARPGAPGLNALAEVSDGVLRLDGAPIPANARLLASVDSAERIRRRTERRTAIRETGARAERTWAIAAALLVFALGAGALGVWLTRRPAAETAQARPAAPSVAAVTDIAAGGLSRGDSVSTGTAGRAAGTTGEATGLALLPANPEDSAAAAGFAVEIAQLNTQSGAIFKLLNEATGLPAATFSPVRAASGDTWFHMVTGAYGDVRGADSLLAALRARRVVGRGSGRVRRLPLALLVQSRVSREAAPALAMAHAEREMPVYALVQDDGTATLYAGAFEKPEDAALLAASLRARGIEPKVVYRTGRLY
jgi:hypothetical protein